MALDRRRSGRMDRRGRADANEERSLFPVWTLIVMLGCGLLWLGGAKIYQDQMAAYESYAAIRQTVSSDVFYPGVTIDGVDLGGMSMEDARTLVAGKQAETSSAFSLVVAAGDKRWRITSQEVPMAFDAQTVLERAWTVGRTGPLEERYAQIQDAAQNGVHLTTGFTYDRTAVAGLADERNRPARNRHELRGLAEERIRARDLFWSFFLHAR